MMALSQDGGVLTWSLIILAVAALDAYVLVIRTKSTIKFNLICPWKHFLQGQCEHVCASGVAMRDECNHSVCNPSTHPTLTSDEALFSICGILFA